MMRVAVRIFHPQPSAGEAEPLSRWLHAARTRLAQRHRAGFAAAGATDVQVISDPADGRSFGRRLRELPGLGGFGGLVVLGSGAVPLATLADRRRFVTAARAPGAALTNNRYSADITAIGGLGPLVNVPDLATDNALPRWLEASAGYRVDDLRGRWRLAIDLDSPLDLLLVGSGRVAGIDPPPTVDLAGVREHLARTARAAADPGAELVVTGRTSASTLAWLERAAACRVRALVEERGLRAGSDAEWTGGAGGHGRPPDGAGAGGVGADGHGRPPGSVLGMLLDHQGPGALGGVLARLGDAAVVDTRVLLAHRLGRDEAAWPSAEDRFASDLLLADRIADPWLRELTASALGAAIPVLLGGHTLVGPGLRVIVGRPGR